MKQVLDIVQDWAEKLGLIDVPLFSPVNPSRHSVLLDGGRGSFALSTEDDWNFNPDEAASWIWSSDLAHHVWLSEDRLTVSRWDDPSALRSWTRRSVEEKIETFYEYLTTDSIKSKFDVVEHSIDVFRRIRSYLHDHNLPDNSSIHVFLFLIAQMLSERNETISGAPLDLVSAYRLDESQQEVVQGLSRDTMVALVEQFRMPLHAPRALQMFPELLVRHASGTVFQEAHFELIRSGPTDLFSLPGRATVRIDSRGGTHFTPPPLARAVVEQAFYDVQLGHSLSVFDPSCGAGAFLHEVLRYLERIKYPGRVSIIGFDISENAVAIARFALSQAIHDCPNLKLEQFEIRVCDSLVENWPECDFILMNPPFISWGALTPAQKSQLKSILGKYYTGRPDYSMAFITKAVAAIKRTGAVGTLVPSSVLSTEASLPWRRSLVESIVPTFLGVFGDYGIFRHATVEVGCLVLAPRERSNSEPAILSLWTGDRRGSAGDGVRHLRIFRHAAAGQRPIKSSTLLRGEAWRLSELQPTQLGILADWRPRPNRLGDILDTITETIGCKIGDVFQVRQGIRAGFRKAFIISQLEYQKLPFEEQLFFRPIAENKNIRSGRVDIQDYIFYPETEDIPTIGSEEDLRRLLPQYYEKYLNLHRNILMERKALRGRDWWVLSEARGYFRGRSPKIVTAYFGNAGSFAVDTNGDYVVVQGFAWFFKPTVQKEIQALPEEARDFTAENILFAYLAILNSSLFSLLLGEFCPHVAGGQFNLSGRFVNGVPLPNLIQAAQTSEVGSLVWALADQGRMIHSGALTANLSRINELVAEVYRIPVTSWPMDN